MYFKFSWLKASKNSTFRIFSRKNLTTRRYSRTFWVPWRHFRWFVGSFRAKNQSWATFPSYFDQSNSPHDMWHPKKTFPFWTKLRRCRVWQNDKNLLIFFFFFFFFLLWLALSYKSFTFTGGGWWNFLCVGRLEKKLGVKRAKNLKMDTTNFSRSALSLRWAEKLLKPGRHGSPSWKNGFSATGRGARVHPVTRKFLKMFLFWSKLKKHFKEFFKLGFGKIGKIGIIGTPEKS